MMNKKRARLRRAQRTRLKIRELKVHRLCVHRTDRHIYAQIISPCGQKVLLASSTLGRKVAEQLVNLPADPGQSKRLTQARWVGEDIARRAQDAGIHRVAFDRSGFKFNKKGNRVSILAEAARKAGLNF